MDSQQKICQNCQQQFTIETEDFVFYEKIGVPAPTFCSECRMIRRLLWRNERRLFKKIGKTMDGEKEILSMYSPESSIKVYDTKLWWSDEWDPMEYGMEYDFDKPFFEQFKNLMQVVPFQGLSNTNAINSEYCIVSDQSKDSYLASASFKIENTRYSNRIYEVKDVMDIYVGFKSEFCYDDVSINSSHNVHYSYNVDNCTDSFFLYDCKNCSNCFGSTNLRNKSYYIFNEKYTKEEYFEKINSFDLWSYSAIEKFKAQFSVLMLKSLHRYAQIKKVENVSGDVIDNAKNCYVAFDITDGAEDCKYIHWGGIQSKNIYDSGPGFGDGLELAYEVIDTGIQSSKIMFTNVVYGSHDVRYALYCHGSSYLFGCIGLRSKQYCILNKQYSKEEFLSLEKKIISRMELIPYVDSKGRKYVFGDFFPFEISPYAYNESIAQDYFPLIKQQAINKGYLWRDNVETKHSVTIEAETLPDHINDVNDSIVEVIVSCSHREKCQDGCSGAFRVSPVDLQFYRRIGVPIPRLCYNCRHTKRLKMRNPMRLFKRQCLCDYVVYTNSSKHVHHQDGRCQNMFETTYAPDRKEIVYCEQCYQEEII